MSGQVSELSLGDVRILFFYLEGETTVILTGEHAVFIIHEHTLYSIAMTK